MKGFIWYGIQKYPAELSEVALKKHKEFIEQCRVDLSKASGGYNLPDPNITQMFIAGDGWSVECEEIEPLLK